ncbi:MAG: hypothetical protein IJ400_03885 [Clostridia bacterium]|nr:hypothetical protein [Clostridia bacterium]
MSKRKISIKAIVVLCVIQLIIIALFLLTCYQRQSVDIYNTNTETILVENADYIGGAGRYSEFYVYSNGNRYEWEIKISQLKGYNSRNLSDSLLNKEITIVYHEMYSIYGENLRIVEAYDSSQVYYTMADYNEEQSKQLVTGIIFLSIAEVLYISGIVLFAVIRKKIS